LSLIKAILKLHQGEITVSSGIDGGSTFTIFLPLMKPDDKQ
jgi:signal transduction histidine kinase